MGLKYPHDVTRDAELLRCAVPNHNVYVHRLTIKLSYNDVIYSIQYSGNISVAVAGPATLISYGAFSMYTNALLPLLYLSPLIVWTLILIYRHRTLIRS